MFQILEAILIKFAMARNSRICVAYNIVAVQMFEKLLQNAMHFGNGFGSELLFEYIYILVHRIRIHKFANVY